MHNREKKIELFSYLLCFFSLLRCSYRDPKVFLFLVKSAVYPSWRFYIEALVFQSLAGVWTIHQGGSFALFVLTLNPYWLCQGYRKQNWICSQMIKKNANKIRRWDLFIMYICSIYLSITCHKLQVLCPFFFFLTLFHSISVAVCYM